MRTDDQWVPSGVWMNGMDASMDGGPMSSGQAIKAARHSGMTRIMIVNEVNQASTGSAPSAQSDELPRAIKAGPR